MRKLGDFELEYYALSDNCAVWKNLSKMTMIISIYERIVMRIIKIDNTL
jgi:hypothetical protein